MPPDVEHFSSSSYIKKLILGLLLLNLLVYTGMTYSLYMSWQQQEARIVATTGNIAGLLENTITGIFSKADTVLQEVVYVLEGERMSPALLTDYLKRQSSLVPEIDSFAIANTDGYLVKGTEISSLPPVIISDREHFKVVRDTPGKKLFVSQPYQSRVSRQWRINIARRINRPGGAFGGVAYATFSTDRFNKLFASIDIDKNSSISLLNRENIFIARYPDLRIGESAVGKTSKFKAYIEAAHSGAKSGTYRGQAAVDGIKRVYSFSNFIELPFTVTVGQSTDVAIASWSRGALGLVTLLLIFTSVTILFARQLYLAWCSEQQVEKKLRELNQELEQRVEERTEALNEKNRQLQKRELQFRNLFENAPVGVFHSTPDGRLINANPALAQMLRYDSPEELLAAITDMSAQIYADPEKRPQIMADLLSADGWYHYATVKWRRKDTERITVDMTGRRVCNAEGEIAYLEGFITDITERTLAEEKVREITERWAAFEKGNVVLVLNELDKGRIYFSNGLKRLLGYSDDEMDNWQTLEQWHSRLAPDEIAGILEKFQDCIHGSADDVLLEHRVRCKNGNWKWVQANGSLVSRTEGSVLAIGTLTDITHIKQMEEELKNRAESLQELVERETMLRLEHERIVIQRSKQADMGEMIGAIAHQWRQPLSTVSVIFQNLLAARRMNKLDEAYLEKAATDATALIRHMSKTIDSFRNFFKPEKTKERFDIVEKIEDAVSFIRGQLKSNDIVVVLPERSGQDSTITGFPNEFAQVILNLLANSRDAILDKRRTQCDGSDRIVISAQAESSRLVIEVRDTGCGIAPEAASRIFEPYFTTKEEGQGTGIGLYMSRRIIEQSMGGTLTFTSKPGETVFRIEVPHA